MPSIFSQINQGLTPGSPGWTGTQGPAPSGAPPPRTPWGGINPTIPPASTGPQGSPGTQGSYMHQNSMYGGKPGGPPQMGGGMYGGKPGGPPQMGMGGMGMNPYNPYMGGMGMMGGGMGMGAWRTSTDGWHLWRQSKWPL
jgi:hypothetical protein